MENMYQDLQSERKPGRELVTLVFVLNAQPGRQALRGRPANATPPSEARTLTVQPAREEEGTGGGEQLMP